MRLRNRRGLVVEAIDTADRYLSQGWDELVPDACPTCGSAGDDPCITVSGNPTGPHAARTD